MRFAPIVPPQALRVLERVGVGYHFVLGQELLRNQEYRRYYAALGRLGHFILVDNGAAEGETPDFAAVVRMANAINASEIIMPDVLFDTDKTVEALTQEALDLVPSRKRMIVPQGRDMQSVFLCLEAQLRKAQYCIESIGIPKHFEKHLEGGRAAFLRTLQTEYPSLLENIHIHLLGVWHDPFVEISQASAAFAGIRGIDSGISIAWAQRHRPLTPDAPFPEEHISLQWNYPIEDLDLAKQNIWSMVRYANEVEKGRS